MKTATLSRFVLGVTYRHNVTGAQGRCVRTSDNGKRATLRPPDATEFSASKRENYQEVK